MVVGLGHELFTTGQLADLLGVSQHTIIGWIDGGLLPGWRLPATRQGGPRARRVGRHALVRFLKQNGMTAVLARLEQS